MKQLAAAMRGCLHCKVSLPRGLFLFMLTGVFFLVSTMAYAQAGKSIIIKGNITNQNGEPLSGVTVEVKGTDRTVLSQSDGSFQIEAPENSTLVISYVGFTTREIRTGVTDQTGLNLQLLPNKNELNQV